MPGLKQIIKIKNPFNNAPVYYIEKTPSTMRLAEEYSSANSVISGTVFLAGLQTQGRGRVQGRIWEAARDKNLLFTLVLTKKELGSNPLPIVVGLGISKYFEKFHQLKPSVKWPNDIYINDRKIAGIIIESRKGLFNIGIGLNINQTEFPNSILDSATSLAIEKNNNFNLILELELILTELKETLGSSIWQDEINARLYNLGNKVMVNTGIPGKGNKITGVVKGIGPDGQLMLYIDGQMKELFSGEIEE